VLVMILGFIASLMKNNTEKNSPKKIYDYDPNHIVNPLKSGKICPKCGQNHVGSAKFCNNCGSAFLIENKSCSKCGSINPPHAQFCQECGNKIE